MTIDSVNLLAQQSYLQIQQRPKISLANQPIQEASTFQNTLKKQFNSFANLSPGEILQKIKQTSDVSSVSLNNNKSIEFSVISNIRSSVSNHENTARKALIGEASMGDLLAATTEAKNTLETVVRVRDKFMESFDKLMNMSM